MVPSATTPAATRPDALAAARRAAPTQMWIGGIMDPSGHADEIRGFLRVLERHGHAPAARTVRWTDTRAGVGASETEQIGRQMRRKPSGPLVAVHEYLPGDKQWVRDDAVNVARVMFETDRMPAPWLAPLLDRDELWVPSSFNVETFARSGIPEERMRILGGTLDFEAYAPGVDPLRIDAPDDSFVFLTNFDFSERKGWRQLLQAWARAFDAHDDVCLVLKTGSFYVGDASVHERIGSFVRNSLGSVPGGLAPIRVLSDILPAPAMPRLYAAADAYVLPSRGEGWGRPYMEALALGLPTIASRFSGNLEFMDEATSWLVDGELVPVGEDADLFNRLYTGHRWFEADVDELASALREVASDPDAARAKAAPARAELIRRFGPDATAHRLAALAEDVWARHGERRTRPVYAAVRGGFGSVDSLSVVNDALVGELAARGQNVRLLHPNTTPLSAPAPLITHGWPPSFEPGTDGPTVAILPWEFGSAPRAWVDEIRSKVDRVWVYSEYIRDGYIASGMPAGIIEVVPLGVDPSRFNPDGPSYPLPSRAGCTFLFVGGTTWRKGADILLAGWQRAFGPDDDVQLVVKDFGVSGAYRNQTAGAQIRAVIQSGTAAPIVYLEEELPFSELPSLYRAADAVVLPYRAEGFCLPALEAMACGVPVVHNGEGPTAEFVGDEGGWPLPAARRPLPAEVQLPELARPGYVHEVDPDDLAERLRAIAADAAERRRRGSRAAELARASGWSRSAERAAESLAALARERLPLARHLRRAEIEARSQFAVYAPDWADEAAWAPALDAWVEAFGPSDDVTLALYVDRDAEVVGERVMARLARHDEADLPDLALVQPSSVPLVALAASAHAVLADRSDDPAARPELLRRARRIVADDAVGIAEYAVQIRQ